jgi:glutathione S-transferase
VRGMTKPKLYYFDAPISRGEECRLAFSCAGLDFEDVRLSRDTWTRELKPTSPFGSLPWVEVDGERLAQSNAILGWIGAQSNLLPKDPFEAARHVAMMSAVEDLRQKISPTLRITEEEAKKKARAELAATTIPQWAAYVEKQLGDGPFFGGKTLSVADIKLHMLVRWLTSGALDHVPPTVLDGFPKLKSLSAAVAEHPGVKAWREKH